MKLRMLLRVVTKLCIEIIQVFWSVSVYNLVINMLTAVYCIKLRLDYSSLLFFFLVLHMIHVSLHQLFCLNVDLYLSIEILSHVKEYTLLSFNSY